MWQSPAQRSVVQTDVTDAAQAFAVREKMARPEGFEPPTSWFVAMRSIQLSYGRSTVAAANRSCEPDRGSGAKSLTEVLPAVARTALALKVSAAESVAYRIPRDLVQSHPLTLPGVPGATGGPVNRLSRREGAHPTTTPRECS